MILVNCGFPAIVFPPSKHISFLISKTLWLLHSKSWALSVVYNETRNITIIITTIIIIIIAKHIFIYIYVFTAYGTGRPTYERNNGERGKYYLNRAQTVMHVVLWLWSLWSSSVRPKTTCENLNNNKNDHHCNWWQRPSRRPSEYLWPSNQAINSS